MHLRDALPPGRVDVSVLFDLCLRDLGIETDYVGHSETAMVRAACVRGRQFDVGRRHDPRSLWRQLKLLWQLADEYDAVVVRDRPLIAALLFVVASRRRLACVYWMSFPFPLGDLEAATSHWVDRHRLRAALVWLRGHLAQWMQDRFVLPRAAHVFVQSEAMRAQVMAASRISSNAITAVPMGIDAGLLPKRGVTAVAAPTDTQTIAYLGSLDRSRRLEVLIDALALVRLQRPRANLVLIGSAPREADVALLRAHAAQRGLSLCITFVGALPMRQAWDQLRTASVCVSPVPPGPLHDVSSPTKVVEYLALGLPVVANDIPDQRQLMEACGAGICVEFSAQAFAQGILQVLADPGRARELAWEARTRVLALRSYEFLSQRVATVLRTLA